MDTPRRIAKFKKQRVLVLHEDGQNVAIRTDEDGTLVVAADLLHYWSPEEEVAYQLGKLIASTNLLAKEIHNLTNQLKEK